MDKKKIIHTSLFTPGPKGRWGLNLLLQGKPGTAKTSLVEEISKSSGLECEVLISSLREPADFLGLPIPHGNQVVYAPPRWAQKMAEAGRGVVFFDELNTSPPAVQAALLRVVLDGVVGDLQLPKGVRFVAAQNATEDAAGGYDLPMPLANRFGHMAWEAPSVDAWADWLVTGGQGEDEGRTVDAASEEARVLAEFPVPFAKAAGITSGFLRKRPDLLLKVPQAGDPAASKAWASPRTWELATRALAGSEVHRLTQSEKEEFLSMFVGVGPANEMLTWVSQADLPDPVALLDGKAEYTHDKKRLDRTAAVLASCAALVVPANAEKRTERAKALYTLVGGVMRSAKDLAVPPLRSLIRAGLNSRTVGKEAQDVMKDLGPFLESAGVRPA